MEKNTATIRDYLRACRRNQQLIAILHYELEHPAHVSSGEMIEVLSYGHHEYETMPNSQGVENLPAVALSYRERTDVINEGIRREVAAQLIELENKQERIDYYLNLLHVREAEVIRFTYFDGLSTEEIADKYGISPRTVRNRRTKAIRHLAELFEYAASLQQQFSGTYMPGSAEVLPQPGR